MKVLAKRAGSLVEGVLRRRAKRRRGLPVVTGLVSCAIGVAVAAMAATAAPTALAVEASAGAAGTQTDSEEAVGAGGEMGAAVADDPAALPAVSADDDQVTVTVPTEVPCVMLGDGSVIGPATWCIENGSDKGARLANVHAERHTQSVEASAATKGGSPLLDVSPGSASFNQSFELAAGESADVAWSVAVTDGAERSKALYGAFGGCSSLRSVDVSALDVSSVSNFAYCFSGCAKLEKLDLSGWDASSARDVNHFLSGCASLKEVDLTGLRTEGVTDFSYFLYGCKSLKALDLSGISTAGAKNGYGMFSGMTSLATVRLRATFSWVGGAYLPLPSTAGVPGTDGKWHSLSSGKAYLPADVPCGVEDSYSALPPATGAAEEPVEGQATGEGEGTIGAESAVWHAIYQPAQDKSAPR